MLIDWSEVEKEIKKVYKRGHSVDGRPAYSGLLLFKMLLLGIWYGLSDEYQPTFYTNQEGQTVSPVSYGFNCSKFDLCFYRYSF